MELSPRQGAILRSVVERYVATAAPVASDVLSRHDFPAYSSATIRNELAALEHAGLIYQPHTSAGRIPSEQGYRFFVEYLLPDRWLSPEEQHTILHQFGQVEAEVDEWLRLASTALAVASGVAAIVSGVAAGAARLRHFDLAPLDSRHALLVAVTTDADVRQHLLELEEPWSPEELHDEAARLSRRWANLSAVELREQPADVEPGGRSLARALRPLLAELLERHERRRWEIRYHDGLANVLSQPEYSRAPDEATRRQRLRDLLGMIEHGEVRQGGLRVLIGEEQPEALRDIALVLCPYGDEQGAAGVLGVIGPTRLDYRRAINYTRYVAGILSALLQHWPAGEIGATLRERAG
jgi:heat-inducible transcriptional repressor